MTMLFISLLKHGGIQSFSNMMRHEATIHLFMHVWRKNSSSTIYLDKHSQSKVTKDNCWKGARLLAPHYDDAIDYDRYDAEVYMSDEQRQSAILIAISDQYYTMTAKTAWYRSRTSLLSYDLVHDEAMEPLIKVPFVSGTKHNNLILVWIRHVAKSATKQMKQAPLVHYSEEMHRVHSKSKTIKITEFNPPGGMHSPKIKVAFLDPNTALDFREAQLKLNRGLKLESQHYPVQIVYQVNNGLPATNYEQLKRSVLPSLIPQEAGETADMRCLLPKIKKAKLTRLDKESIIDQMVTKVTGSKRLALVEESQENSEEEACQEELMIEDAKPKEEVAEEEEYLREGFEHEEEEDENENEESEEEEEEEEDLEEEEDIEEE